MELNQDIHMDFNSIQAKQGHFGSSTDYIAAERRVVHRTWGARRRLWGLIPPKQLLPTEEYLDIPECVTTEDALWDFVQRQKPGWIHRHHRRK